MNFHKLFWSVSRGTTKKVYENDRQRWVARVARRLVNFHVEVKNFFGRAASERPKKFMKIQKLFWSVTKLSVLLLPIAMLTITLVGVADLSISVLI